MRKEEQYMKAHPEVDAWLRNRPLNTKRSFARELKAFSEFAKVTPEKWRHMDKFKARDLAWQYVEPLSKEHSVEARQTMIALKSWYRNLNGEVLPLDSGRGGKHNIPYRAQKAIYEKIPSKAEVYQIVDMAGNLRDKALFSTLFQSGIRVNALTKLTYGLVADQLDKDIITLKITSEIDDKLRGANISFYYTFVNGEGAIALRQYCQIAHKNSKPSMPLFYTKGTKRAVSHEWVWWITKKCVQRAGFDKKTMWVHSFRKAFRKIVRQADIDDDDKEQLMGHAIKGSRQAYYDRHDTELIMKAYQRCNFTREVPQSEVTKLRQQLENEQTKRTLNETRIADLEKQLLTIHQQLNEMLNKKEG
jgi:integrase